MSAKRKICIAVGILMLLTAVLYLVLLMPQTAKDEQERLQQPLETAVEETAEVEVSDRQIKETDLPDIDINSWEYVLVNADHSIGEYAPELGEIEGQKLDQRILEPMQKFVGDARAEGLSVFLSSGYRGYEEQQYLFNRKVEQYGEEQAATIVSRPGTSEHQTGLACDITDEYYELKNESLENTALYQWMSRHCQKYGFIVRYPKDKEEITGIIYEPWHFRYVGVEAATYMAEHNLCLEEFVALYQ